MSPPDRDPASIGGLLGRLGLFALLTAALALTLGLVVPATGVVAGATARGACAAT